MPALRREVDRLQLRNKELFTELSNAEQLLEVQRNASKQKEVQWRETHATLEKALLDSRQSGKKKDDELAKLARQLSERPGADQMTLSMFENSEDDFADLGPFEDVLALRVLGTSA